MTILSRLCVLVATALGLMMFTGCSSATNRANEGAKQGTGFTVHQLPNSDRKYGVFVPHNYDPSRIYPVILFLHGGFENGSDPNKAFSVGLGPVIAGRAKTFSYIAIFPQARTTWRDIPRETNDAYAALQDVRKNYKVDNSRVILTGLSWGGYGVWALAQEHPGEFAALVPMCGNDKLDAVPVIKGIPTWAFHNSLDPFISVGDSKAMVNALKKAGGNARLTTYLAFGHAVWNTAYNDDELWTWLSQQRRTQKVAAFR